MSVRVEAFKQGLRELGYTDGENLAVEYHYSEGKLDRLNQLAVEIVARKVSVIVTHGDAALTALKRVTKTIPIVVAVTGDLVETGYAASLARPGGNITGFVDVSPDLSGKRIEILKEMLPKVARVAILWNSGNRVKLLDFKESEKAAAALGLTLQSVEITKPGDFHSRLSGALVQRPEALVVLADSLTLANSKTFIEFATKNKLPTMYGAGEVIDRGGLMSYAANVAELFRQAAGYMDKILKGANPAVLPIQQPTKFEFIVNLKAAMQIGLTIPPQVLARADRVLR
jgi:putative ABC transport system substrate-binding protein